MAKKISEGVRVRVVASIVRGIDKKIRESKKPLDTEIESRSAKDDNETDPRSERETRTMATTKKAPPKKKAAPKKAPPKPKAPPKEAKPKAPKKPPREKSKLTPEEQKAAAAERLRGHVKKKVAKAARQAELRDLALPLEDTSENRAEWVAAWAQANKIATKEEFQEAIVARFPGSAAGPLKGWLTKSFEAGAAPWERTKTCPQCNRTAEGIEAALDMFDFRTIAGARILQSWCRPCRQHGGPEWLNNPDYLDKRKSKAERKEAREQAKAERAAKRELREAEKAKRIEELEAKALAKAEQQAAKKAEREAAKKAAAEEKAKKAAEREAKKAEREAKAAAAKEAKEAKEAKAPKEPKAKPAPKAKAPPKKAAPKSAKASKMPPKSKAEPNSAESEEELQQSLPEPTRVNAGEFVAKLRAGEIGASEVESLNVKSAQDVLAELGLPKGGKKGELTERILEAVKAA